MADRRTRLTDPADLPVLTDEEIAEREARNGLLQFDRVLEMIREGLKAGFRLRPSAILELNRIAVDGLEPSAGTFRVVDIHIDGTSHVPPPWQDVPREVDELCDYVSGNWESATPLHLAAFCMWRVNWIHPFTNGNGRTSRAVSYLVLCTKLGYVLPGTQTIPEMIAENKGPYYDALDEADARCAQAEVNVSAMENLLTQYLAAQLLQVVDRATGNS